MTQQVRAILADLCDHLHHCVEDQEPGHSKGRADEHGTTCNMQRNLQHSPCQEPAHAKACACAHVWYIHRYAYRRYLGDRWIDRSGSARTVRARTGQRRREQNPADQHRHADRLHVCACMSSSLLLSCGCNARLCAFGATASACAALEGRPGTASSRSDQGRG